ncbi:hypothetical protein J6590_035696 [Homalodisca vitripennis]|nr:hypothetical protein J6590_035696 [Homalodisca vitripennis]
MYSRMGSSLSPEDTPSLEDDQEVCQLALRVPHNAGTTTFNREAWISLRDHIIQCECPLSACLIPMIPSSARLGTTLNLRHVYRAHPTLVHSSAPRPPVRHARRLRPTHGPACRAGDGEPTEASDREDDGVSVPEPP